MKKLLLAIVMLLVSAASFAVVNVNTATQAELESLQGIGPVKAKAIINDRIKNGPFKTVDDLDRVKGIGKVTIDNLRKDISVSGATTIPAAPGVAKKDARRGSGSKLGGLKKAYSLDFTPADRNYKLTLVLKGRIHKKDDILEAVRDLARRIEAGDIDLEAQGRFVKPKAKAKKKTS